MSLPPGQKLGPYEILAPLGAGGMGEVYRARDGKLGRDVALKVLPPDVTGDPVRLERFDREARAIAALNHPHIVTIYSTEEIDGTRFITMELVEGHTLDGWLVRDGRSLKGFFDIAIPLADALAAAHKKHITHRDLKPGNVMISAEGRVKVLDFGLARVGNTEVPGHSAAATRAPITQDGLVVGTMPYMSPEQVEGRELDPRSDLFSLGVMFYEMLSGARPFSGASSAALMSSILRDTPPSITETRDDIPDALARLVSRCLEKRPEDRIQTARDVYNELRHVARTFDDRAHDRAHGRAHDRAHARANEGTQGRSDTRSASIAVLPFADLSPAKDQDWFCDGMAEEILNALAPLPGLRVAARASAFSFKGRSEDLGTIGEKLNVTTVLTGSVRRAGDRVRITAQLSDAREGRQLWSERFDRELKDIFDVQDEIARAIVGRLRVTLGSDAGERLVPKATANLEAYELLLKGRVFLTRRGPGIVNAIECFEKAIALDPNLADAHAGLGDTYRLMGIYGLMPGGEAMPRARASLDRALAIEPNQVEALATVANITHAYNWDFAEAMAVSDHVLALDPSHVRTLAESAITSSFAMSPTPSAKMRQRILSRIERARTLDPLNAWVMAVEGLTLSVVGSATDAVAAAERAVATDPANFTGYWARVVALGVAGRHDEALRAADAALTMSRRHAFILAEVAAIHAAKGEVASAGAIYEELRQRATSSYVSGGLRAAVAASAGRLDETRALLAQALADHDPYVAFWRYPAFRHLLNDEESMVLLRASKLWNFQEG